MYDTLEKQIIEDKGLSFNTGIIVTKSFLFKNRNKFWIDYILIYKNII